MLLSAVSVLVVAQSSSEIPEGLMNNPVIYNDIGVYTPEYISTLLSNIFLMGTIYVENRKTVGCLQASRS